MEGSAVVLMNEFLREYVADMANSRVEVVEVKALISKNHPETVRVVTLIIYMYKKTKPSPEEITKE